ncbi:WecB/TagA/CpsF family glycosyltransferase [Paenalkalicoccus suaedae]|uniref:N-acetylglucosaminyldiphosphoundecaprenol N-acetyl-beta-D-mannosaminyltransferase n=1 Tax=Paenalkalicoccus suaedae TaxID=2592382 RepID=A0A859FI71_9BACI|nr:WecB/TagA/CpsF family glycosyltransferase [Paenalkalicoccus suaedae]QKS72384.1 WecB/TagA/CpsF family glycosyltransferase [Paenalkalicoccus suaedae]
MIKQFDRVNILGVPFVRTTLKEMSEQLVTHAELKEKAFVVTANPEIVLHAYENDDYKRSIDKATYVTADGIGVVKGAQLIGEKLPERVTGFDLFMRLLTMANEKGQSIYLLGASKEVLPKTIAQIETQFPHVKITGSHHGFFDWADDAIPNEIRETKPDYVFVALGLPRQENWIAQHMDQFDHGVFMGIGGSFDVLAGEVKRAPMFWQKIHLEWFYRLLKQPSRIGRMMALPRFGIKMLQERKKQR